SRDTANQLRNDISKDTPPREIASKSEGQGNCRIQMRSAYRAHEIDDRHDHQTWRDDDHVQSHFAIALCGDYVSPSGHNNEQKRAPALRKYASPFARGIEELMFRPLVGAVTTVVLFV